MDHSYSIHISFTQYSHIIYIFVGTAPFLLQQKNKTLRQVYREAIPQVLQPLATEMIIDQFEDIKRRIQHETEYTQNLYSVWQILGTI